MGETTALQSGIPSFATLADGAGDGMRTRRVIGTYLHGAFEVPAILEEFGIVANAAPTRSHDSLAAWFAPYSNQFASLFL
jgi:cobyric acid synthase